MEHPAVQNAYGHISDSPWGGHVTGTPTTDPSNTPTTSGENTISNIPTTSGENALSNSNEILIQNEENIYNFALNHEYEHMTQNGSYTQCATINETMVDLANDAKEEISDLQNSSSQNVLSVLQNEYNEQMCDFSQIKILSNLDGALAGAIAYDKANETYYTRHWSWGACGETTVEHKHQSMVIGMNNAENMISSLNALRAPVESNLEQLDPSSTMGDLISSLNGLSPTSASAMNTSATNTSQNIFLYTKTELSTIHDLLTMIKEQIEIDSAMEAPKGSKEPTSLSVLQVLQLEEAQAATFNSLSQLLDTAATNANTVFNSDKKSASDSACHVKRRAVGSLGWNSSNKDYLNQEIALRAQERLQIAIANVQNDLTTVGADMALEAFDSITLAMSSLMADVQKILTDTHLTPKEKEAALAKILQLVLGFLQTFIQIAENLRSQSKKKIEQANITAQKTNLQNLKTDGEIYKKVQEEQHKLAILHKVMIGIEILATIAFVATGTIGVAIAMIVITSLDLSGQTNKWTDDLSNDEHSKLGGSATMTGIAMAATLLGGSGIDMVLSRIASSMEAAVETAMVNSEHIIEAATEKAADSIGDDQAEDLIHETATQTAEMAAKTAAKQFYKEMSSIDAMESVAKTILSKIKGVASNTKFEKFIINAIEDAIKRSVEEAASSVASSGTTLTPEAIRAIGEKSAAQILKRTAQNEVSAAASTSPRLDAFKKMVSGAIEKIPENTRSALFAGMYTAAATNMFVNFAQTEQSDHHDSKESETIVRTLMSIIQMLMESVAMMKGGGFLDLMKSEDPSAVMGGIQRGGSIMQVGSQGITAGSSFQEYVINEEQAKATQNLEETQAYNNMLRALSSMNKGTSNESNSGMSVEEKRLAQEQIWLSTHLWDGTNAGCKVLTAQSI